MLHVALHLFGRRPERPGPLDAARGRRSPTVSRLGEWPLYLWPPALALAALAVAWEAWTRLADVPSYVVPAPTQVLERLFGDPGFFLGHAATTLQTAAVGFALGATIAIGIATLMAHSRLLERAILPIAIFVRVIPLIVWALMFVVWFGFGLMPKVLIVVLITFFPIMVNALTGLRSVNPGALDFFRSVRASRTDILLKLRLPGSLPYLFAAFRTAVPLSVIGAFVGELFLGNRGLGSVIAVAHSNLDMPTTFSAILVLALIGIALMVLTNLLERRVLFWHESYVAT